MPATGERFALMLPEVSTTAMQAFLDGFSASLGADEHAVMVTDQAGWHVAHALAVPGNVTLVHLPPYSPELNPVERVRLFLRERHLNHRVLNSYTAIVGALCAAWNQLTPKRIQSLTCYPYISQIRTPAGRYILFQRTRSDPVAAPILKLKIRFVFRSRVLAMVDDAV